MEASLLEWLNLLVRWIHVLAGIAWIGHAFFFHSIHHHMAQAIRDRAQSRDEGDMWMIHGGGFYYLRKTKTVPKEVIPGLLWFKWEAGFTWISGFILLVLVFYMGGGAFLVQPELGLSAGTGIAIGVGSLVLGWLIYDAIWASPLGRQRLLATGLSLVLLVGATYALSFLFTGRAAYLHIGALMGTIMAANVWMRIIPGQKKMLAALERDEALDQEFADRTADRSLHNGYMQFPVIFIMISNHYPSTYAHEQAWVVLLLIMVLGAAGRQLLFDHGRSHAAVYGAMAASVVGLVAMTVPLPRSGNVPMEASVSVESNVDPDTVGQVTGRIHFDGSPPEREPLPMTGCPSGLQGQMLDDRILVEEGRLAGAVVHLAEGTDEHVPTPPPTDPLEIQQIDCIFLPRVSAVRTGQPVAFVNEDPVFHNVRSAGQANETFNHPLPEQGQRVTRTFRLPELAVPLHCDPHPWMVGQLAVFDHPWFDVSDGQGTFSLEGVPPGTYVLEAWHEVLGTQRAEVTVPPRGEAEVELTFAPGDR